MPRRFNLARLTHGTLAVALLATGTAIAVHFVRHHPQPVLFGDPEAYYVVGHKLQQAVARLWAGEAIGVVFGSVRDYLYFVGVGALYGLLDALRPGDIPFLRLCLVAFGLATMVGSYVLARQLSGSAWAGLLALAISAVYPSYSVQVGRLFPEPAICCFFVWSAAAIVAGVRQASTRLLSLAGLLFTVALLIRAQLFNFMLAALALTLLSTAGLWVRQRARRCLVLAFVLGCAPVLTVWITIQRVADVREVERFGFFTFSQQYPYGFWQYLDADGYIGPYRLRTYPFYNALDDAAKQRPELLTDRWAQWRFTAGYVAQRAAASTSLVLENMVRLWNRPANDFQWDYPLPLRAQVCLQYGVVLLALAGMAAFVAETPALAGAFFVPLALLAIHALSFPRPRYGLAAMPILIGAAAGYVAWLARRCSHADAPRLRSRWVLCCVIGVVLLWLLAAGIRDSAPEAARWLRGAGWLGLVAFPFAAAARLVERRRPLIAIAAGLVLVAVAVHLGRDQTWHERDITVSAAAGAVEQEIDLTAANATQLRAAREVFLVVDLTAPGGGRGLRLQWNGRELPEATLFATMPHLSEATVAGGRSPQGFPQWWALRVPPDWLPPTGGTVRVGLRLTGTGAVTLRADRHREQQLRFDGPSFGDWPRYSTAKLEHVGDYRLPVSLLIESDATRSFRVLPGGGRRSLRSVLRIRLITLSNDEGRLAWETDAAPAGPGCFSFYARSGRQGEAALTLAGGPALPFPLGSPHEFMVERDDYRLCYRPESQTSDSEYGEFALVRQQAAPAGSANCEVRFLTGMSLEPLHFSVDVKHAPGDLCRTCAATRTRVVNGARRVSDASRNSYPWDKGRGWSVAAVY